MRASRSVGRRVAQGLRTLASKAGKGEGQGVKAGQATGKGAPAAKASGTPAAAPAPPGAPAALPPKPGAPAAAATVSPPKPAAPSAAAAAAARPPPNAPAAGSAAAAAGGTAAAAEGAQKWIVHPAVPVDARLLAAGLVGAGLLAYNLTSGGDKEGETPVAGEVVEVGEVVVVAPGAQQAQQEGAALADAAPQHVDEGFHSPQQAQQDRQLQSASEPEAEPATVVWVGQEEEQQQGAPALVDGAKVLSVIEEVLTLDATRLLEQAGAASLAQGGPAPAPAPAEEQGKQAEPEREAQGRKGTGKQPGGRKGKGPVFDAEEMAAIQSGLADSAGDLLASNIAKAAPKPAKAAPELEPLPPPPTLPQLGPEVAQASGSLAGLNPLVKQVLGLEQDVTPAGLIQQAQQHGQGAGDDWLQYRHRHRQAVADAHFIVALLEAAAKNVKGKLEEKDQAISQGREQLEVAGRLLRAQGEEFRKLLLQALEDADRQARAALKLQSQQLAVAHAEVTVRERAERQQKVDEVRIKLNALEQALQRRASEQRTSHNAHQIAVGAFALQSALESGQPLRGSVEYLSKACKGDPLVDAALATIPSTAAEKGVWTREQIADAFQDVQRLSRQLTWVPEGQGGLLTITLAKIASKLKLPERGPLAAQIPGGGIDASLAVVQSELVDGKLLKAAEDLEAAVRGTAAAPQVSSWVQHVRARVLAEQTAALLQAHASALTVSLA